MRHTTIANLESLYHITNTSDGEGVRGGEERKRKGGRAFIDDLIFRPVRKVCRPQREIDSGVCPRL